jgi:hypothetical protein
MKGTTSHNIKKHDVPKDVFYTPDTLVKIHLEQVKATCPEFSKGIILDAFKGKGAYFN